MSYSSVATRPPQNANLQVGSAEWSGVVCRPSHQLSHWDFSLWLLQLLHQCAVGSKMRLCCLSQLETGGQPAGWGETLATDTELTEMLTQLEHPTRMPHQISYSTRGKLSGRERKINMRINIDIDLQFSSFTFQSQDFLCRCRYQCRQRRGQGLNQAKPVILHQLCNPSERYLIH